jgi:hypothetical protein
MTRWYRIVMPTVKEGIRVSQACKRIGIAQGSSLGLLSYVVHTEPKRITLLQLEFSNLQIHQYSSMGTVLREYAVFTDTSGDSSKFAELFSSKIV